MVNLYEEWQGWDYFERKNIEIEKYINNSTKREEAKRYLEKQKEFVDWKQSLKSVYRRVNYILLSNNISICEYFQVYGSPWYFEDGFYIEQDLAKNSIIPNEDFEIILAALYSQAHLFVTHEEKGIVQRAG